MFCMVAEIIFSEPTPIVEYLRDGILCRGGLCLGRGRFLCRECLLIRPFQELLRNLGFPVSSLRNRALGDVWLVAPTLRRIILYLGRFGSVEAILC